MIDISYGFNEGTKILILNKNMEDCYIEIENLKIGDIVKTYIDGYRKIKRILKKTFINNPDIWQSCMFIMKKDGLMTDDLILSGMQSILVDINNKGLFRIYDKYLIGVNYYNKFKKIINRNEYTYYNIILDNDCFSEKRYIIWANGIFANTINETDFISTS
jgi:hypothetical protein